MAWELILWLISFCIAMALLALTIYQLMCLSDMEFDCLNPYDTSSRINTVVIPEFVIQGALCVIFLLTWHWFMFLITAPVAYYNMKLFVKGKHLIDVTEIYRLLNGEKKYRIVKLIFYFVLFGIVIFRLVETAVTSLIDEDNDVYESGIF
ncbi:hypothetical protein HHK36_011964 [Tetracentron sinense]|uniref:Cornichon n=1 Tax=Tetracentron sinense TaxID=13715 RepID=A0A835DHQ0_TETSI|nr:hypothetical protein HHK36_011964 [Tetracentron sinense]